MKADFELLRGLANCADKEQMMRYIEEHQPKPMTNADRIRAMTDEELAVFICDRVDTCSEKRCPGAELCRGEEGKANGLKKWLQQPVEEDDG